MFFEENKTLRWSELQEITNIFDECGNSITTLPESEQAFHWDHLLESSLGRIWQYTTDPNLSFAIISPYLTDGPGKLTEPENRARVPEIIRDIRDEGYGYVILNGYWKNDKDEQIRERSFLIPTKKNPEDLLQFVETLRKKYSQTAFTWKQADDDNIYGVFANGKVKYGKYRPDKIGDNYSQIVKGSHAGRNFVFESLYNRVDSQGARALQSALFRKLNLKH